jgi:hypothetical protein
VIERHADIYACGVIMYEMLAGRPPFEGPTYAVLVSKLLTQAPPPLNELRPGLPASLVRAVHRALEKEPADRFDSAEAFAAALPSATTPSNMGLGGTLDSGVVTAMPSPGRPGRFRNVAIAGVAFTLAAAATAVVLVVTNDEPPVQQPPPPQVLQGKPDDRAPPPEARPPAAAIGTLEVKSKPSGAAVIVDGRHAGNTPIVVTLEAGRHQVRIELAGYVTVTSDEEVRANKDASAVFTLAPADGKPRGAPVSPGLKTVKRPPAPADEPKIPQQPPPPDPRLKPQPQQPPPDPRPKPAPLSEEPKKAGSAGTKPNPY